MINLYCYYVSEFRSTRLNSTASGLLPANEVSPDTGYSSDDFTEGYCKTKSKINSIV